MDYQGQNQYQPQNQYQQPSYQPQNQYQSQNPNMGLNIPPQYKPLSPWAYFGYNLLYAIPLVGFILLIINAFSKENINKRNYARSYFCALILVIPFVIFLMCVVPAIIMSTTSSDTISQANYAAFVQEFGEYSDMILVEKASLMADYGMNGEVRNNAQLYYEVATGKPASKYYDVPYGENFDYDFLEEDEECYEITVPIGYYSEIPDFYEDENEKHYVTSKGTVFTLPGYEEKQADGTTRYYVNSSGAYYTK